MSFPTPPGASPVDISCLRSRQSRHRVCLTRVSNVQSLPVVAHAAISRTDMGGTPARAFRHVDARPRGDTASQVIEKPPIPMCLPPTQVGCAAAYRARHDKTKAFATEEM